MRQSHASKSPIKREPGELVRRAPFFPRASRWRCRARQLAKERDALRHREVNASLRTRLRSEGPADHQAGYRRQPPTPPPPRAPPPEQRAFQDVERRCTDLERELEDQRAAHEYRIHALRDEFEKLRDAHERKLRAVKAEAARKAKAAAPVQRKAPTLTENTVVGPKKAAGISRQALHAIEEQSRKDHEAKVKAEQKAERPAGAGGGQGVVGARAEQAQGVERAARVDRDARLCVCDVVAAAAPTVAREVASQTKGRGGVKSGAAAAREAPRRGRGHAIT